MKMNSHVLYVPLHKDFESIAIRNLLSQPAFTLCWSRGLVVAASWSRSQLLPFPPYPYKSDQTQNERTINRLYQCNIVLPIRMCMGIPLIRKKSKWKAFF